jgi:trehalose-6-phosphatase
MKAIMGCGTRVIVITGRAAHEVASLLGVKPTPEIWGNDGLERLFPDGRYECGDLQTPVEVLKALAECEAKLEREGLKSRIDVKLTGVAVLWRGLTPSEKLDVRIKAYRVLQPLTLLHKGLRLVAMEEGFELRLPVASKADAVQYLIHSTPPGVPIAYMGHSVLDEDLFRTLNGRGLTVLVRSSSRFSAAQVCLKPPDELAAFLKDWVMACGGEFGRGNG